MKINIDPVIASRIRKAWAALPPDQRKRIAPLLARAHQQALTLSRTRRAPAPDPAVKHQFLLAHSAITNDQDGVLDSLEAGVVIDVSPGGEIWGTGRYEELDPGWAEAAAVWLEHLVLGKHDFGTALPDVISIPNKLRIALAGDWGTGDWRTDANPAPSTKVGRQIAMLQPELTIHLGDVYYAGTAEEEDHLFVSLWPSGTIGALTLNSNHEMYSGATPYFQEALGSSLFGIQQRRSFFALENDNWVIVGLDSAYYSDPEKLYMDGSLYQDGGPQLQLSFLRSQAAKSKKVIVLTHNNGLSGDGSGTTMLWSQVLSAFPAGAAPAYWYWGHVHAGAVYRPKGPGNVLCRCNGHGALPWGLASELVDNPNVVWFENRPANDPDIPERMLNGFAVLSLDGPELAETFYDENGGVAWTPRS